MELPALDSVIHQPARVRIMTVLYRNRDAAAADLRRALAMTPGNLASHAATLERAGYLRTGRTLVALSFEVRYRITARGSEAFLSYLDALEAIIVQARAAPPPDAPSRAPDRDAARPARGSGIRAPPGHDPDAPR